MVTAATPARADDTIIVSVKTPMMPSPTRAHLPARLNLRSSVQQITRETPKDAHASRVIQQLIREMSDVHHFLVVTPSGIEPVDPEKTTLDDIAIPKEIRTDHGLDLVRMASIEVQAYARVGK